MYRISPITRVFLTLFTVSSVILGIIFIGSFEVAAGNSSCCNTQIDPNISVTPSNLPFGKVFPEEVILKPIKIELSATCIASKKIETVGYTIKQQAKARNSKDDAYCATNPNDIIKCYPSICPYLSKTPDGKPANDSGVPAFHDPSAASSIAYGQLNQKNDTADTWQIDFHAPCFKGQCAQDNVIPKAYELNPALINAQFACNLNIEIASTSNAPALPAIVPFKEKKGTTAFWKDWTHTGYTEAQINAWLAGINVSSGWLITEAAPYTANTTGLVALISDANSCNGASRPCAKKKFLAEYLATRLDIESGRKLVTGTYIENLLVGNYWGTTNPVSITTALAKTEGKLPDNGVNPTLSQFILMQGAFSGINSTGI